MFLFFEVNFITRTNYVKYRFTLSPLLLLVFARRSRLSTFREMSAPFFQSQMVRELPFPFQMGRKTVKFALEQATKAQAGVAV